MGCLGAHVEVVESGLVPSPASSPDPQPPRHPPCPESQHPLLDQPAARKSSEVKWPSACRGGGGAPCWPSSPPPCVLCTPLPAGVSSPP